MFSILVLLTLTSGFVIADEAESAEAIQKFNERAEKTNEGVADAHVSLARWCLKVGLNAGAHDQLARALKLVPEHKKAMKELGYRQKKVDGVEQWVRDEKRAPPETDAEGIEPKTREEFTEARDKLHREAAEEYVKLGEYAQKLELPARARAAFELAVKYDPLNEEALAGAGWVKDELDEWISPREAAEREQTAKALSSTPLSETMEELPDWTSRAFPGGTVGGQKFGKLEVITTVSAGDFGKYAWATAQLCSEILGGNIQDLRVVVANGRKEHEGYCTTRHPGIPGLKDDYWVLGDKEVEVVTDAEDDNIGFERIVYSVAIFEIRRRCGDTTHPWFEVGFASNLTRRLLGRVTTAEFSGEAEGPSESGRWKRTLRQLVYDESAPKLERLIVDRDPDEHEVIFAHFFIRYLCIERAAAVPAFCAAMKSSDDDEEAFKSAFEQDAEELNALFVDWFERN
ncbi:MAG: hypothetical protein KDB32_04155 [Planctomycetes bacterium]|nr:hypothetical protein [Planctomycetota bacterium]